VLNTVDGCTFQSDLCEWHMAHESTITWTRHYGSTPSDGTGPQVAHTDRPEGKYTHLFITGVILKRVVTFNIKH